MNTNINTNQMNNSLFIAGKIGTKDIAREDLNTFLSSIKDFEWTDNNIYKPAKVIEVNPMFAMQSSYDNKASNYQSKNINFDVFYVEENPHLQNFQEYRLDIENRRTQMQDKIIQKKKEFIDNDFVYSFIFCFIIHLKDEYLNSMDS